MNRKLLVIGGAILVVLIILGFVLPMLIDVDRFRPTVEAQLTAALGRQVSIGKLSISAFFSHVTASDLVVADDPAFSKEPFLTAKEINVDASILPLLTGGGLQVAGITLVEPQVTLIHAPSGKWNFSSLGTSKPGGKSGGAAPNVSVGELRIKDGKVNVGRLGNRSKVRTYSDVNVTATNVSLNSKMSFTVDAKTPGGGDLNVGGTAGPLNHDDAAKTPLNATIALKHVELANTGFLDPASGIAGTVDFDGVVKSDGEKAHSEGKARVEKLRLARGGQPATIPVGLDYGADVDLDKQGGELTKGLIQLGKSTANLGGTFDLKPETPTVKLNLTGKQLPISDVQGLLPAVGVVLPHGASLEGGTANANLALLGPIDRLVTTGTVNVNNTRLTNFNLGSAIKAVAAPKTGSNTDIQLMACKLRVAPDGIRTDDLNLVMPALGTAVGSGTISAGNALNYKLQVKLAQGSPLAALTALTSLGAKNGGNLPLTVTGTTSAPIIVPDVGGMLMNPLGLGQQGQGGLGDAIGGLFGKKKK